MLGITHAAGGAAIGAAVGAALGAPFEGAIAGGLAALLPDIDHPGSVIGRRVPLLPVLLSVFAGHRGITHTAWFCAALTAAAWAGAASLGLKGAAFAAAVASAFLGSFSHLLLDGLTRSGVQPFMPLPPRFTGPLVTGDFITELPVCVMLFAVCLYFLI